ncbi:hypothetical protein ACSBR1_037994 [Camellia fascicularis]
MWSERIIRFWVTEGFVNAIEGKTIEEVAKGYLDELLNRSLIQVAKRYRDGRPSHFCIHDVMREIIVSKRVFFSTSFSVYMGADGFIAITSLRELFRRCSRLLKVLDLEGTLLETIPDEVFKLIHLRYLGLRDTKVKMVPKLIGKLENLETLDLAGTYVIELPDKILYLQKLHNLISYHLKLSIYFEFEDYSGFKVPSQIGSLQSLQVLWMIEIDQRSKGGVSIVKELGRLTQLRELGIGDLRREDGVTLCSSIEKLSNLRVLYIISTKEDEILDLQFVSPVPPFFQ